MLYPYEVRWKRARIHYIFTPPSIKVKARQTLSFIFLLRCQPLSAKNTGSTKFPSDTTMKLTLTAPSLHLIVF
jgi:hypothetical protein